MQLICEIDEDLLEQKMTMGASSPVEGLTKLPPSSSGKSRRRDKTKEAEIQPDKSDDRRGVGGASDPSTGPPKTRFPEAVGTDRDEAGMSRAINPTRWES